MSTLKYLFKKMSIPVVHYSGMLFSDTTLNIRILKTFVTMGKGLLVRI